MEERDDIDHSYPVCTVRPTVVFLLSLVELRWSVALEFR